ncbi:MAG: CarD family transcriptional regulator [Clostridia bacterium]|nr:CarD family transcriptional regulator [Clostridia bacterium]MDD4571331.1 CarD family transcriptional regulator [Clostridia bacterium]
MYQIGDLIVYGRNGVCRVENIGVLDVPSINKNQLYYTLSPI